MSNIFTDLLRCNFRNGRMLMLPNDMSAGGSVVHKIRKYAAN